MKVSIITPVYNASSTIERCGQSILSQTWKDIEWIVVDDCSTDCGANQVKDIAQVITLPINLGVAAARNVGLDAATGDYVYFVDADDWIEADTIETLVRKAETEALDIVGCEWRLCFEKKERRMTQPDFATAEQAMCEMMLGTMRWNLWLFMVKRTLWDGLRFIPGQNMGEDMAAMFRLFLKADNVGLVKANLYHYAQPTLSKDMTETNIAQVSYNVEAVESAIKESVYAEKLLTLLPQLKLIIKLPLLISSRRENYLRWKFWFSEADSHVMDNHSLALRTRLLMWCASKRLWAFVWLYYWIVYKFVYGVIYR